MNRSDFRDWFIIFHVNAAGIASTWFLFKHPESINFGVWTTFIGTIIACYHWFTIRDSKQADQS